MSNLRVFYNIFFLKPPFQSVFSFIVLMVQSMTRVNASNNGETDSLVRKLLSYFLVIVQSSAVFLVRLMPLMSMNE